MQMRNFGVVKKYTESHEWIEYNDETKTATMGITDHAQSELGEVVYIELPEPGTEFDKSDVLVTVESTKTAADVYQMVGGEVIEANEEISGDPSLVNKDAEGKGWMVKMSLSDESQLNDLLDLEDYKKLL